MANIFKELSGRRSIFKNEAVLKPDYLPEQLIGRESQIREIAYMLKDAEYGKTPAPILLIGKPGTGKTTTIKYILKQLTEVSTKPVCIYINCWENYTKFGILSKIVIDLGSMSPRRGLASDELLATIAEVIRKNENVLIVVLDEIDRLIANSEESILYDLARAKESMNLKATVIGITNMENFASKLDSRIASSLIHNTIKFEPYNILQLKDILKERAKLALWSGAYNEDIIGLCAAIASKAGGDARFAIHLLWASAKKAEEENSSKITIEHVYKIRDRSMKYAKVPLARKIEYLDEIDKTILGIIVEAQEEGISSGKIYEKLNASDSEQRTIRNRLERLEKEGLIYSIDSTTAAGGKTRIWKVKLHSEEEEKEEKN
ncbi:MAG: AAA family ATPase [Candidatus Micrarchaeota archaeon]|nr:AAA family ATPase [Candidatus Micrarchaeota archaeon]